MAIKPDMVEDGWNLPSLNQEEGSPFGWYDRLLFGWRDGMVFDYGDWEARDLYEMMGKDYKARQLENVLTLPFISATHNNVAAKGDKGEMEWLNNFWEQDHLNGGCRTPLNMIVDLMTSGVTYKKAFFEKVWVRGQGDFADNVVYGDVAWRPQTTCRMMRDPKHGRFAGFEQEAYYIGPEITKGHWPIQVKAKNAFVYVHGLRRDPINGTSDMEIAYWAYKTKQKILFLWFQFLENVSLPRVTVTASDPNVATQIAQQIARLKSSGVIPLAAPQGPESVKIDQLDVSGKGAEQFLSAIQWLDNAATDAVLAGFLNLVSGNAQTAGASNALSKDASDFFLQMEEATAREMEYSIRKDLYAPLIRHNFGKQAAVPHFKFEPLNDVDKATTVTLFQSMITSRGLAVPGQSLIPDSFVEMLAEQVAGYIGLDGKVVSADFAKAAATAAANAAKASAAGASPAGQAIAGVSGAVTAATQAVKTGVAPRDLQKATKKVVKNNAKKQATKLVAPTTPKPAAVPASGK